MSNYCPECKRNIEWDGHTESSHLKVYEHWLRELLAVVHRDGGHHHAEHGVEASTKRAMEIVGYLRNEDNAQLRKQVLAYQKDLSLCRKVLYFLIKHAYNPGTVAGAAERCLKELKQK